MAQDVLLFYLLQLGKIIATTGKLAAVVKQGVLMWLRKPGKGNGEYAAHYRNINILDHLGKGIVGQWSDDLRDAARPLLSITQQGGLPQRSTDMHLFTADEICQRF